MTYDYAGWLEDHATNDEPEQEEEESDEQADRKFDTERPLSE